MTKSDQIWGIQKQDFAKCLKINNLQRRRPKADPEEFEGVRPLNQYSAKGTKKASLAAMLFCVPRAGIEPARPFRAKGFSYHYGFRHHFCLWSGLFLHHGFPFRCAVSSLCTFLYSEAWLKIAIGVTRYGFLEFTAFYISLFRECTQFCSSSVITCEGVTIWAKKL